MKFIADFHIHSHYSIATSKKLIPEHLDYWARMKGITVVGTGDFTHPGWLKELKEKLLPAEPGLFRLKDEYVLDETTHIPILMENDVRFILTAEISNIYKKGDRVRKVHNVIFAPDFETAETIQDALSRIGNITSDGRPILGLDSRDLLEMALNASDRIFFVPAHIWTPWFSALGSKSGFDTIDQCYDDLSDHIFAVETGLSSDPPMNWMCRFLDKYTLISNSDAHSPEKLGREANLFDTELTYDAIIQSLKSGDPDHFLGTVEFFPQEGKYHYDGHRKCGICWNPVETLQHRTLCPVCGKKVTVGVMNRIVQLSDRQELNERPNRSPFYSVIPLKEILSEILGKGPNTKQVNHDYHGLIQKMGSEFNVLVHLPEDEIQRSGNALLAEAVRRMRQGDVFIQEGYDGEFGIVRVFREDEHKHLASQNTLFADAVKEAEPQYKSRRMIAFDLDEYRHLKAVQAESPDEQIKKGKPSGRKKSEIPEDLNSEQRKAVEHFEGPALIIAGPGTGKTRVLTVRIAHLIQERGVHPKNILAVTFTNKAAQEMKERLKQLLSTDTPSKPTVSTFHALGYAILKAHSHKTGRDAPFLIIDRKDKEGILTRELGCDQKHLRRMCDAITEIKQNVSYKDENIDEVTADTFSRYEQVLRDQNLVDLDDLIYHPVRIFNEYTDVLSKYRAQYPWILIDEYQDINLAQYRMIRLLMPDQCANLCAIGDPNQAIYGFRGADVRYIRQFQDDYPNAAVYRLTTSFRCTDSILKASQNIILEPPSVPVGKPHSTHEPSESFLRGLQQGVKINISHQRSDRSEAEFVARTIERMVGGLRFFSIDSDITPGEEMPEISSLSDFAVLYRIHHQIKPLQKAFTDHSIPYQTIGDTPFFQQHPIDQVIDVLKLAIRPETDFLKTRLIGAGRIHPPDMETLFSFTQNPVPVKDIVSQIVDRHFSEDASKDATLFRKLMTMTEDYGSDIEAFLNVADLGTGADTYASNTEEVTLMTLHAAKGLEFECVFIVGCEDGLLPYSLYDRTSDVEEERRLLYVGMTRAKKFLTLSHAEKRFLMGRQHKLNKSPFLDRIEEELIERSRSEYRRRPKARDDQLGLFS